MRWIGLLSLLAMSLGTIGCNTVTSYGRPVDVTQDGNITYYTGQWNIPEYVKPDPSYETLLYYGQKVKSGERRTSKYAVSPASSPRALNFQLESSSSLSAEMQKSSILSYIYYDSGVVRYSERSPQDRFGKLLRQGETYHSNSMGKSLVSYVVGHAICEGYIDGLDSTISDWELMQGTVYGDQQLIDLLNMAARDSHIVNNQVGLKSSGRWYNSFTVEDFAKNELKDTQPKGAKVWNYHGLLTNVIMNYAIYKSGDNFEDLLHKIFSEKVGIAHEVYFNKLSYDEGWYQFHATPEDYLRIAIAIMEDWQQDTCVGQYLKELDARRIPKALSKLANLPEFQIPRSYGGQFYFNFKGMSDRNIVGLSGYGNQSIVIDMDNSRIVVVNTIHTNYDWKKFVVNVIRDGDITN